MAIKVTFYLEGATLAQQTRLQMRKQEVVDYIKKVAGADPGVTVTLEKGVSWWEVWK